MQKSFALAAIVAVAQAALDWSSVTPVPGSFEEYPKNNEVKFKWGETANYYSASNDIDNIGTYEVINWDDWTGPEIPRAVELRFEKTADLDPDIDGNFSEFSPIELYTAWAGEDSTKTEITRIIRYNSEIGYFCEWATVIVDYSLEELIDGSAAVEMDRIVADDTWPSMGTDDMWSASNDDITCEAQRLGVTMYRYPTVDVEIGAFDSDYGDKLGVAWILRERDEGASRDWNNEKVIYWGATPNQNLIENMGVSDNKGPGETVNGLDNYVVIQTLNNDLGQNVIGTAFGQKDDGSGNAYMLVADWTPNESSADADSADLNWDFLTSRMGTNDSSSTTGWINVTHDSAADEWVITHYDKDFTVVQDVLSGIRGYDDWNNMQQIRFTFTAEDGTVSGADIIENTFTDGNWNPRPDLMSYDSETGQFRIVLETDKDDPRVQPENPNYGREFTLAINAGDGAPERGQVWDWAGLAWFAWVPASEANAALIPLLDLVPTPVEAPQDGSVSFPNEVSQATQDINDAYNDKMGTLSLATAWERDEDGVETYFGIIDWTPELDFGIQNIEWVVLTSAPDSEWTTWGKVKISEGREGEPFTFKNYYQVLNYSIEELLNGEVDLHMLEGDANTSKLVWTFDKEDGSVNGKVIDQEGSFEGEWVARPDRMTFNNNELAPIRFVFARPADGTHMDSSPGYIFSAAGQVYWYGENNYTYNAAGPFFFALEPETEGTDGEGPDGEGPEGEVTPTPDGDGEEGDDSASFGSMFSMATAAVAMVTMAY